MRRLTSLLIGGIVHVSALGQNIVILNDPKYAIDMLDKKSLLYSDRPTLIMGGQIVGWEEGPALSPFCDRWAEYRRLMSQFMGTKVKVDSYNHVLQEETNVLLKHILAEPREWVEHVRKYVPTFLFVPLAKPETPQVRGRYRPSARVRI